MTNAARQAIPIAPLFHCHIQALTSRVVAQAEQREVKQQYQRMVVLTSEAQAEPLWWARTAKTYNSATLLQPPPDLVIEMDASLSGWGARCQELHTGGLWSVEEHNALELPCNQKLLKEDCCNILIQTDNMTAKAYMNHRGHPLANNEFHNNPAVEMAPGSPDSPDSLIPPRGREQDCGQGVQGRQRIAVTG